MYWQRVVNEVKNQSDPHYPRYFTPIHDENNNAAGKGGSGPPKKKPKGGRKRVSKRYPLGPAYPGIYFTLRETQCMMQFCKGKTILRVASHLNLSHRTVEFYLRKMKNKLKVRSKIELVAKVLTSDLPSNVDFDY